MKNIYDTFEFQLIKDKLQHYANTELGKMYVEHLNMYETEEELQASLDELKEAMAYAYKYSSLVIHYHPNIIPTLISLKKGGTANVEFFYQISFLLENIKLIKEDFKEKASFPILNDLIENIKPLDQLKARIDRVVSPTLEILDSASSNLMRIRSKILHLESSVAGLSSSLVNKYRNYLTESHGAYKNGIFTLMVKSTYKNRIPGIVHGVSDTGSTIFIEPQELIEVYNEIASLHEEEIQEIQAILKELSVTVASYDHDLLTNNNNVSRLDFDFARANFAISYHGEIASIAQEKTINLQYAAHPLIDPNKVVRNNFVMEKEKMMIITGPNAGGKTVALKVVGLLVIMHQCGLALPIKEGGKVSFFKHIYADIGDNQSLIDNLSTFSSHIINIQSILSQVDEDSLVIIDELGSGTSPLDGEAIGLGTIDYLLNKDCFCFISSHYEAIKNYALENPNILCASMIFDEKEIRPTYKLLLHVASPSYGIEVAYRLGLNDEVIKVAKDYIADRKLNDKEIKIESLNKLLNETEQLKAQLQERQDELDEMKKSLQQEINNNKNIKAQIVAEAEEEKQKLIDDAKEEIDEIFKEFKKQENYKLHQVIEAKRKIDNKAELPEDEEDDGDVVLQVNDHVEIKSSKVKGRIIRMDKSRISVLLESGLTIQTKSNDLRKLDFVKEKKKTTYTSDLLSSMKKVPVECNIIGLTVKEGIEVVSKYLDDCVTVHYKQVRIIHGSGTGKLREGVHNFLKKHPFVDSFRLGGGGEGGVGATVVYLK